MGTPAVQLSQVPTGQSGKYAEIMVKGGILDIVNKNKLLSEFNGAKNIYVEIEESKSTVFDLNFSRVRMTVVVDNDPNQTYTVNVKGASNTPEKAKRDAVSAAIDEIIKNKSTASKTEIRGKLPKAIVKLGSLGIAEQNNIILSCEGCDKVEIYVKEEASSQMAGICFGRVKITAVLNGNPEETYSFEGKDGGPTFERAISSAKIKAAKELSEIIKQTRAAKQEYANIP